jgi:hypothetical protein
VLLDDKNAPFRGAFRLLRAPERFRSAIGTTFAAITIEWHGQFRRSIGTLVEDDTPS